MKPTEHPLDEALRNALKRRFDDFEVMPSDSLSEKILMTKPQSSKSGYLVVLQIILLLTLGIGSWVAFKFNASDERGGSTVRQSTSEKRISRVQKGILPELPQKKIDRSVHESESSLHNLEDAVIYSHKKSNRERSADSKKQNELPIELVAVKPAKQESVRAEEIEIKDQNSLNLQMILRSKVFHTQKLNVKPVSILLCKNDETDAKNKRKTRPFGSKVIFSFTPINTFQHLTILRQPQLRYRNFQLPSSFSSQTLGYSLQSGIERKGFQILLSYSRFQQLIRYEVATNEYIITPRSTDSYAIAQEGVPTISQTTFHLLGLAVQKKFFLPNLFLPNLYLQTGASIGRELGTSQNLATGIIGIGKQWPVAPNAYLSVATNLNAGLNTLKTNDNAFKNRFYQMGVSLELSFGKD